MFIKQTAEYQCLAVSCPACATFWMRATQLACNVMQKNMEECIIEHAQFQTSLCSGDSEAEQEQAPRRRTARPQANPRRLFGGGQSPPRRPPQGLAPAPKRAADRPQRATSKGLVMRQDLLAPVMPGHESDEETASEADMEVPARGEAGGGVRTGGGLSLRRLGEGPRASPQRGAAALRDVREDFVEAGDPHQDGLLQGEPTLLEVLAVLSPPPPFPCPDPESQSQILFLTSLRPSPP